MDFFTLRDDVLCFAFDFLCRKNGVI
jgi:hypothetical protein